MQSLQHPLESAKQRPGESDRDFARRVAVESLEYMLRTPDEEMRRRGELAAFERIDRAAVARTIAAATRAPLPRAPRRARTTRTPRRARRVRRAPGATTGGGDGPPSPAAPSSPCARGLS